MKRKTLELIISDLIQCDIANSWKGGGDPADSPEIEDCLLEAKLAYTQALDRRVSTKEILT